MANKPTPKPPTTIIYPKPITGAAARSLDAKADEVVKSLRKPKKLR